MAKRKAVKREDIYEGVEPLWKYVRGTGQWNAVIDPDQYDKWSTNLYGDEVLELKEELQAYLDEAVEIAKKAGKVVANIANPYAEYNDKEYIQFKKKFYDEDTTPPKLYNITGEEITGQLKGEPGGGSELRVRAIFKPYYMATTKTVGLSKGLLAVQIINNKQYVGASGFEDESTGEKAPFDTAEASEDY